MNKNNLKNKNVQIGFMFIKPALLAKSHAYAKPRDVNVNKVGNCEIKILNLTNCVLNKL